MTIRLKSPRGVTGSVGLGFVDLGFWVLGLGLGFRVLGLGFGFRVWA